MKERKNKVKSEVHLKWIKWSYRAKTNRAYNNVRAQVVYMAK